MARSNNSKRRSRKAKAARPRKRSERAPAGLPAEDIQLDPVFEQERQQRLEQMKAQLLELIAEGRGAEAVDQVLGAILKLERANELLAWRALLAERYRFGRSTEKLSREELRQLVLAFGGDEASANEAPPLVPLPDEPEQRQDEQPADTTVEDEKEPKRRSPGKRNRGKPVNPMQVSDDVERQVNVVKVPEEERACAVCNSEMQPFGEVRHELIRYVPAKIVVDVELREKIGCKKCRQDIAVASRVNAPAVMRKVDASLLAKLVAEKCVLGLPLDRQGHELERLGLRVPYNTLQSYWAYTIDLLEPVAVASLSTTFGQPIVGADDSHLKTLKPKGGTFRGHLWCFVGSDGTVGGQERVGYGYTPSWNAAEIASWFSAIDGFIQCDGYAGYSRAVEVETDDEPQSGQTQVAVPDERRLGCGMHIRSKFHAALLAKDQRAAIPLKHFADLYAIEDDCKQRNLDAAARHAERSRRSLPILKELDQWVDDLHPKLLPKSPLRRATTYAINQRAFFHRCFSDGRFEIDNGRVERRIRLFATARRGFLFTGSPRGGERLAVGFTLVDNAALLKLSPEQYLVDIIRKLEGGWPLSRLSELTPHAWAAQQALQKRDH